MALTKATPCIISVILLVISASMLGLTTSLIIWSGQTEYPTLSISGTPISSFPANYSPVGLVLNLVTAAGGTIDSILLIICFLCIDFIYLGRRPRLAKVSTRDAAAGRAPTWLWGVTIFIAVFSICRTIVGFVGSFVGYYTSPKLGTPFNVDADGRYVSEKAFGFGGWMCQLKSVVDDGEIGNLCTREQAARWMTVSQLVLYISLTVLLVLRFRREKARTAAVDQKY